MRFFFYISNLLFVFNFLFGSLAIQAKSVSADIPVHDSLLSESYIKSLFISDPSLALRLLDEVEKKSPMPMPQYKVDLYRSLVYSELRMHSLQKVCSEKLLVNDSVEANPEIKLQVMTMLIYANSFYESYNYSMRIAEKAITLARELGNLPAEYLILQTMSDISFKTGNSEDGYNYLQRIIDGGYGNNDVRILANVSSAYGSKIRSLYRSGRYEEAFSESRNRLHLIKKMEKLGGTPSGYIDQQKAYSFAKLASIEEKLGNPFQADIFYRKFLSTEYGQTTYAKAYIIEYLLSAQKYSEALSCLQPLYPVLQQADTINNDYYNLLFSHSAALAGVGKFKEAYEYTLRSNVLKDSLFMRERKHKAQELSMAFKMNENELALVKSNAESKTAKILLLASLGVVLIIFITLIYIIRQYRSSIRRNKIAAAQIDELIAQKEQSYQFQTHPVADDNSDYSEFVKMEKKIVEHSLFLQHNFNRDSIAEQCNIPRTKVTTLIQQYANTTPGDYINKLKVQYSVKLINEHREWTIDAIAEESGYSNRSTYYQNFYKVFGITPAQYRKQTVVK